MSETAVTKKVSQTPNVLRDSFQRLTSRFPELLPPDIPAEQFRAALWLELQGDPALGDCTESSLRECIIKAATYGLLPGRDCHFLPFRNKHKSGLKDATYVPNYQGIILALERSGKVRRAFAHPVHEGDEWSFNLFEDRPVHRPAVTLGRKQGKEVFYYGAVMFHDGTCAFEVVTLEDLEAIEKRAPGHESNPWSTDRVMMRRKTALKRVAKYVRLTPEVRGMLEEDEARGRLDIPVERTTAAVIDLFGDGEGSNPTHPETLKNVSGGGKVASMSPGTQSATPETHERHPDATQGPSMDPTLFHYEVEKLWAEAGLTPEGITAKWASQEQRFKGPISAEGYAGFLIEQRQWVAKRLAEQDRKAEAEATGAEVSAFAVAGEEPEDEPPF